MNRQCHASVFRGILLRSGADYGWLTNGGEWRLMHRNYDARHYFSFDLPLCLDTENQKDAKLFFALLTMQPIEFIQIRSGLEQVLLESQQKLTRALQISDKHIDKTPMVLVMHIASLLFAERKNLIPKGNPFLTSIWNKARSLEVMFFLFDN